jgi:hypothetical protein
MDEEEIEELLLWLALIDWWVGWIEEVPGVNCQKRTHEELVVSLKTTLQEALEFNRQQAIQAADSGYAVNSRELSCHQNL